MKRLLLLLSILFTLTTYSQIKNYLFVGMDRDQLRDTEFYNWTTSPFEGVQIAYSWKQLERQKDNYDFSLIDEDLKLLQQYGKKLFIQFEDVSFSNQYNHTPKYLLDDPDYHDGAARQYKFKDYNDQSEYFQSGWVVRRWDPAVQNRLYKLFAALGNKYDGIIEGINLEETSVEFGSGPLHPPGFSFPRYRDAVIENLAALKKAFPRSTVIAYANFMPGGFRPTEDTTYLRSVYEFAWKNNIGVGGPDLLPYKPGQMSNSYGLIQESYKKTVTGVAVQDGTGDYINPKTEKEITAEEIYQFAKDYLHLTYVFWGTEDPFFHSSTVPFLETLPRN